MLLVIADASWLLVREVVWANLDLYSTSKKKKKSSNLSLHYFICTHNQVLNTNIHGKAVVKQSNVISLKNLKCFNVHKDTRIFLFSSAGCVHFPWFSFCTLLAFDLCSPKIYGQSSKLFRRSWENQLLWLRISFKKVSSPSQTNVNGISLLLKDVTF